MMGIMGHTFGFFQLFALATWVVSFAAGVLLCVYLWGKIRNG